MTTAFQREVSPSGFDPAAVGQRMISVTQAGNKRFAVMLGQWEMFIAYFKHGLEIPLCIAKEKSADLQGAHRMALIAGLGMGEMLSNQAEADGEPLEDLGYASTFIASNLRYLRETYQQWYGNRDDSLAEEDEAVIRDALTRAAGRDS